MLRELRRVPASGEWVSLSGADPLNLVGILTPGARLPALTGNRLLFRDGLPVASLSGDKMQVFADLGDPDRWEAEKRLCALGRARRPRRSRVSVARLRAEPNPQVH